MSVQYPDTFRLPENVDYVELADMGILRTRFDTGFSRQRRRYVRMPTVARLTFIITQEERGAWQQWWNEYACGPGYFEMPAPTMVASLEGMRCETIRMRGISDLEIAPIGYEHWQIKTLVMFDPAWVANHLYPDACLWIIAGDPQAPSVDWVNAGSPAAAPSLTYYAGTPLDACISY